MAKRAKFEQVKRIGTSFFYNWMVKFYKDDIGLHFHPEMEICYMLKGAGYRICGDFIEPFTSGEIIFSPSNMPHCWLYSPESCAPDGNFECVYVQFLPSFIERGVSFFPEWKYTARTLMSIKQCMSVTGEAAEFVKTEIIRMQKLNTTERLLSLIRIIQSVGAPDAMQPIGVHGNGPGGITKSMNRIQTAIKYIVENYKYKISLQEIASETNMSCTAFSAFFKKETGKNLIPFINEYRIEAVCSMLKNFPDKSINEIAWENGFTDTPYFNRQFKKTKQMTPREWRSQL